MQHTRMRASVLFALIFTLSLPFAVLAVSAQDQTGQTPAPAQPVEPPLSDTRLTVHTLLREDVFSGFMEKDMKRFARGEKNIDLLLEQRPNQKANLLAWKAGTILYRAVLAYEDHHKDEFERNYQKALDLLSEASKMKTGNDGVNAITGGVFVVFADRLPKEKRATAWKQAYDAYQALWKQQSAAIDKFPVHFRGEVMAGLVASAERTGHTEEAKQYLDKMLTMLRDTPYEPAAKQWKENPKTTKIACLSCHDAGRLAPRLSALNKQ